MHIDGVHVAVVHKSYIKVSILQEKRPFLHALSLLCFFLPPSPPPYLASFSNLFLLHYFSSIPEFVFRILSNAKVSWTVEDGSECCLAGNMLPGSQTKGGQEHSLTTLRSKQYHY